MASLIFKYFSPGGTEELAVLRTLFRSIEAAAGSGQAEVGNQDPKTAGGEAGANFIDELQSLLGGEESMFRAQLLREDLARLQRLVELATKHGDREKFRKAGAQIGWTNGDLRTQELMPQLTPLLDAVYDWHRGGRAPAADQAVRAAWDAFHVERMRKLLHGM